MVHIILFLPFTHPWDSQSSLAHSRLWEFQKQRNLFNSWSFNSIFKIYSPTPSPCPTPQNTLQNYRFMGHSLGNPEIEGMNRRGRYFSGYRDWGRIIIDWLSQQMSTAHVWCVWHPLDKGQECRPGSCSGSSMGEGKAWAGTWAQAGLEQMNS